jgi:hypothetical protein
VLRRGDLFVNGDGDAQLLRHLPDQAGLEALSGLSLAARKFPITAQMSAACAASNHDLSIPDYETRRDFDHRGGVGH